jgi:hypothetical protein
MAQKKTAARTPPPRTLGALVKPTVYGPNDPEFDGMRDKSYVDRQNRVAAARARRARADESTRVVQAETRLRNEDERAAKTGTPKNYDKDDLDTVVHGDARIVDAGQRAGSAGYDAAIDMRPGEVARETEPNFGRDVYLPASQNNRDDRDVNLPVENKKKKSARVPARTLGSMAKGGR